MDVVEPYLLQLGFLNRTAQGRVATEKAYKHLNLPFNETILNHRCWTKVKTEAFDYDLPQSDRANANRTAP